MKGGGGVDRHRDRRSECLWESFGVIEQINECLIDPDALQFKSRHGGRGTFV